MKRKSNRVLILAVILFSFVGCSPTVTPRIDSIPNQEISLERSVYSDVDIYIDSTPSMSGFASKKATYYINLINDISSISNSLSGTTGEVNYYSFGGNIISITQTEFLQAQMESFYIKNKTDNRITLVSSVIKDITDKFVQSQGNPKSKRLAFIITDLFEDNSNMDLIVSNIKPGFAADISLGVMGIKCYFDGKVYDVGRNKSAQLYTSAEDQISSYRPVYVIAIGSPGDVLNTFEMLGKLGLTDVPEEASYFELFSNNKATRLASLSDISFASEESKEKSRIKPDTQEQKKIQGDNIVMLKYLKGPKGSTDTITTEFDIQPVDGTRLSNFFNGGGNILADRSDELFLTWWELSKMDSSGSFINSNQEKALFVDVKADIKKKKLAAEIVLNSDYFEEGVYKISIETAVNPDVLTPVIPSDWNLKNDNDPAFGSKTINLYNILESLHRLYYEESKPIMRTDYYIKVME